MKYYEMHETVYRGLKQKGVISWDKSSSFEEMWNHSTNLYLQKYLDHSNIPLKGLKVLDLGTGTGTSALFTAKEGSQSVGVELSPSALEIARANAQALGLDVELIQEDVLALNLRRTFDLVIDSTLLHCLVGVSDREKFYQTVKRHLEKNGHLFINTMVAVGDMSARFPKEYFVFEDPILWSIGINEISDRKTIAGKSYFPHRTILTVEKQIEELNDNGFEIVVKDLDTKSEIAALTALVKIK